MQIQLQYRLQMVRCFHFCVLPFRILLKNTNDLITSQVSIIFSHIITRISYFRWDDDDMRYVLDQHI
jgi:hypothetical protein